MNRDKFGRRTAVSLLTLSHGATLGGVITSTLLTLLVLPALYRIAFGDRAGRRESALEAVAQPAE